MSEAPGIRTARRLLSEALAERCFPAATLEVGSSSAVLWQDALGTLTFDEDTTHATADTVFDLASLTKPLVTTTLVLDLIARDRLHLSDAVSESFSEWRGDDRKSATIADLLEHASGLPARLLDVPQGGRREFQHDICASALACAPRMQSIYSDLGFLLLGFLAEDRMNERLDRAFALMTARLAVRESDSCLEALTFGVPPDRRSNTAPTEPLAEDRRGGRRLVGEVHDNYAAALGGIAGHAGLFGTAAAVGVLARELLVAARGISRQPALLPVSLVQRSIQRSTVPGSSRALGWDTMLTTSSCGARMSGRAFGHVGFTGASLWIDPVRDRYFVLLTNRVCGGGTVDEMRTVRRAFHDALGEL